MKIAIMLFVLPYKSSERVLSQTSNFNSVFMKLLVDKIRFQSSKMIFYVSFMLLFGSFNVIVAQNNANFTRCDQLPLHYIEYKWLIDSSPFYIYRGNTHIHKCARVVYVGPDYNRNDYLGSGIIIQGSNTYSYELSLTNNTVWETILCLSGFKAGYRNAYTNFNSNHAALCVINCTADGSNYNGILCMGRTPDDEADIQKFVDTSLKGVPGIKNLQTGCTKPKYCDFAID